MRSATTKIGYPAATSASALRAATLPPPTITARRPFGRREIGSIQAYKDFRIPAPKTAPVPVLPPVKPARAALVGAIVAALATLPGLGAGTLWDNSETAYGEVAREILLTHDWVVMHLNARAVVRAAAALLLARGVFSMLFGGATTFALRLPSALATIAMGGLIGYAVARQAGTRVGIYAAVVLSTC